MIEEDCPHILIGTSGRVLHLINEKVLKLDNLKRFILDECDDILENGLNMRRQEQGKLSNHIIVAKNSYPDCQ